MARMKSKRSKIMAKFAVLKKIISPKDARIKPTLKAINKLKKKEKQKVEAVTKPKTSSVMFLEYNTQLGPPYHVIVDTNFINFAIKFKMDIFQGMMDCMYAKCIPYISECVIGELEKLGNKYNVALKICKDPRFERLTCMHKGTYADDCILERVRQHKCFIVATNDMDLKRRIRKVPGVPIMYIARHKFTIERMPDAYGAPRS